VRDALPVVAAQLLPRAAARPSAPDDEQLAQS
jgi:hypothetical protein